MSFHLKMLNSAIMRKLRYDELAFIELSELQPKPFEPLNNQIVRRRSDSLFLKLILALDF